MTFRYGRDSHDWPRFKGLVDGVLLQGKDFPGKGGRYYGIKSVAAGRV